MDGGVRLRTMRVGDVLDETFRVYRRHFLSILVAMAVVAVLSVAFGEAGAGGRLESFVEPAADVLRWTGH